MAGEFGMLITTTFEQLKHGRNVDCGLFPNFVMTVMEQPTAGTIQDRLWQRVAGKD